ncbi:hypothetical protein C8F04DRAFT_1131250 [Mycena alexandri]|uniref:Uncharacterized protein n=1 Tax=Mycena alexandri TaxID=1745969 RepID=A0AAD6SFG9_9AGAR|nr:hypothetical protein C8F04DRAFT_1131250 [Mycena alexandri]
MQIFSPTAILLAALVGCVTAQKAWLFVNCGASDAFREMSLSGTLTLDRASNGRHPIGLCQDITKCAHPGQEF